VYVEFRIGDDADEFGIIDRRYAPKAMQPGPGGTILYWHVEEIEKALERLNSMGAQEYDPITKRGESGFVTASVIDLFGNILGIMYNPHYVEVLRSRTA
jgi:predicted enzyme related to lactoylglutathione lyase